MNKIMNHFDSALSQCQVFSPDVSFEGLENYRGRALCLTYQNDIIQIPDSIKYCWNWITDHYDRIGLVHTKKVIWDSSFEIMSEYPEYEPSLFMFTKEVNEVLSDNQWLQAVNDANSKNCFIKLCEELGIPTPHTVCFDSVAGFSDQKFPPPLYFKGDVSVSGLAVTRCETEKDLLLAMKVLKPGEGFQLQEEITALAYLNIQYEVECNVLKKLAITEQILNGNSHNGNLYPSEFSVWEVVDPLANYLFRNGMKGVFAFDVAITKEGPLVIECNPRFNGSTYPTKLASKLGISSWLATSVELNSDVLDELNILDLEYDAQTQTGIIVYNWGCVLNRKLGVLIAADSREKQQDILSNLEKII